MVNGKKKRKVVMSVAFGYYDASCCIIKDVIHTAY